MFGNRQALKNLRTDYAGTKMATVTTHPMRVGDVSFYDRYGFAVYNPESEFAEEDCRTHEYK